MMKLKKKKRYLEKDTLSADEYAEKAEKTTNLLG